MPRNTKFDRDQAIETIMHKIWKDGFHASSVKSISELLGITRSSFYNAFGDRESLFKEVFQRYSCQTPLINLMTAKQGDLLKPLLTQTLRELCAIRSTDTLHSGCLTMNSVAELGGENTELSHFLQNQLLLSNSLAEQLIGWAVESKELDKDTDIKGVALAVTNLFVGLNVMSNVITSEADLWLTSKTTLKALNLFTE